MDEVVTQPDDETPGTSLSRRKVLGVGALALGGAALAGLAEASSAEAAVSGTTSLSSAAAQGATSVTVVSTLGFTAGRTIWLDTGTQAESVVIQGVAASSHTLKLKQPLKEAHKTGGRVSVIAPLVTAPGTYKTVLKKLLNDATYATAAVKSPTKITSDYPHISMIELEALRDCAILSGADMGAINSARGDAIAASAAGDLGLIAVGNSTGGVSLGFSISCCSCCCCIRGVGFPN